MTGDRRGRLRRLARSAVAGPVRAAGYELIRRDFYSPVPDLDRLPAEIWERRSELPGVAFDPEAGLSFVREELAPFLAEYRPPAAPTGSPRDFYLDNGFYGSVDAETLYAMVRRFRPSRIVELGSGLSTLVIADARAKNGDEAGSRHDVYDPFAREDLAPVLADVADLHRTSAAEVKATELAGLRAGDVLFVDTTHTVKIGSEVNRIVLELLPSLAPGVIVHVHDIFLPWEYPREFVAERRFFWAEQYLLQAFLAFNDEFEILFSAHALQRLYPDQLAELIPASGSAPPAGAFWIRRRPKSAGRA